ncbi:MAG: hypothetical protein MRY32_04980 [Rickettsiales bacterium]|nr:hypothetical protein [Rickettsiales bacterium]
MDTLVTSMIIFGLAYLGTLVWIQKKSVTTDGSIKDFFVAGGNIKLRTAIATLGATEIGLITIAYNAQKGFNEGYASFHIGVAAFIGALIIGTTGFIVKRLHRTGVLTLPEFYQMRYGKDVRVAGAIIMALAGILNMGLFLKVASLFLTTMMPELTADLGVEWLMVALISIAVFYTCFGGMQSVIATDVLQFLMLAFCLLAAVVFYMFEIGLGTTHFAVGSSYGTAGFNPLDLDFFSIDYVLWVILFAGIVSCAVWPTALSRVLCIENERTTQRAYLASSLIFLGRMVVPAFLGVCALAYFHDIGTEYLQDQYGEDADLVATASMFAQTLPQWALAAMVVAMFASFMSTQDGYLFCWASILSRDVIGVLTKREDDTAFQKKWTRICIILIAAYEVYWGLIYEGSEDIWNYMGITGSIYFCSGIVLITGGLYWRHATRLGAWLALLLGFTAVASLPAIKEAIGLDAYTTPQIGFATIILSLSGFFLGSLIQKRLLTSHAS